MPNTRDIRRRIKSITNTAQITRAMELVAASKMKKAQDAAIAGRPYGQLLAEILCALAQQLEEKKLSHPLLGRIMCALPYLFLEPDPVGWGNYLTPFTRFLHGNIYHVDTMLFWARLPNVLLGALIVVIAYFFAKRLFGPRAGALAAFLCAFSPNLLAHARIAYVDIGFTCFSFLAVYAFWRYVTSPSRLKLATFYAELGRYAEAAAEVHAAERLDAAAAAQFVQAIAAAARGNSGAAALLNAITSSQPRR